MQCVANGHEIVALANLKPGSASGKGFIFIFIFYFWTRKQFSKYIHVDELDSFMYQTVGHDAIHFYAECMDLPLYRREITGTALSLGAQYEVTPKDETEDLYELLKEIKVGLYYMY